MAKNIFVGSLPFSATEETLRKLFGQYGQIQSVSIIKDRYTSQSRGFGFVEMGSENDAKKAISGLNGKPFMGKPLTVVEARPQQPRAHFHGEKGGFGKDKSFKKAW